jgi:hypothetical protein
MESEDERFYLTVPGHVRPSEVPARLNATLPEGLAVEGCRLAPSKSARQVPLTARYRLRHKQAVFDAPALESFAAAPSRILTRTTPKGREVRVELKEAVFGIDRRSAHELEMTLRLSPGSIVRPGCVIRAIFNLPEDIHKQVMVRKLLTTPEMNPWTKN